MKKPSTAKATAIMIAVHNSGLMPKPLQEYISNRSDAMRRGGGQYVRT